MNGNFKVGEVLVGHGFVINVEANGMECVVLEAAEYGEVFLVSTQETKYDLTCKVEWQDGLVDYVPVRRLRRKRPPTGEASILNMFVVAPPKRMKEPA